MRAIAARPTFRFRCCLRILELVLATALLQVLNGCGCRGPASKTSQDRPHAAPPLVEGGTNTLASGGGSAILDFPFPAVDEPTGRELSALLGSGYDQASDKIRRMLADLYRTTPKTNRAFVFGPIREILQWDYRNVAGSLLSKLEEATTVPALRAWADECIRSAGPRTNDTPVWEGGTRLPFEQLPAAVRNLADTNLFLGAAIRRHDGQDYIMVRWGTPLSGLFGIVIGPDSFRAPPDMGYFTNRHDGIYAWHTTR